MGEPSKITGKSDHRCASLNCITFISCITCKKKFTNLFISSNLHLIQQFGRVWVEKTPCQISERSRGIHHKVRLSGKDMVIYDCKYDEKTIKTWTIRMMILQITPWLGMLRLQIIYFELKFDQCQSDSALTITCITWL